MAWPTLGDLADAWIEQHCRVPDMWQRGEPFRLSDWQFWATANHYRIRDGVKFNPDSPPLNQAFTFRRSQIVGPQKSGKGPWAAAMTCLEAVGPSQFAGWADGGEVYDCRTHRCGCGWMWNYEQGDPMGVRHPSPLIQLTATSEDQVDNVYRPLTSMIDLGPLSDLMAIREGFVRILGGDGGDRSDRIDVVTSKANSRVGNPVSFVVQDETGLWVKSNGMIATAAAQRRGLAGMGGRSIETTNPPDPAEDSVAQRSMESAAADVFRFWDEPPRHLSFRDKRERRRILKHVYRTSPWVNLDSIEAEAAELMEQDPAMAERFFGNRVVAASDSYFDSERWGSLEAAELIPAGATVALGFDGSMYDDWTAIRARWIRPDGSVYGFTPTFADGVRTVWNPADNAGVVPRGEVGAAVKELMGRYRVVRFYLDPELWQSEIDAWAAEYGAKVVLQWPTNRTRPMSAALERLRTDIATGGLTHDGDHTAMAHLRNARSVRRQGGVVIGKPNLHQKIDVIMADCLAHEAAADAIAAGLTRERKRGVTVW